jgi:hypothetical protein
MNRHHQFVRHYIRYGLIATVLITTVLITTIISCALILSTNASANNPKNNLIIPDATNIGSIETITVTYRNAFDYALYQQTTEMLLSFNRDLSQSNLVQVQQQSRQMAAKFGFYSAQSITFNTNDKSLQFSRLLQSLDSNE